MKSNFQPANKTESRQFGPWTIQWDQKMVTKNKKIIRDKFTSCMTLTVKYVFQNNAVVTFIFRKRDIDKRYWINDFDAVDSLQDIAVNKIPFIDSKAAYADLINYYLTCLNSHTHNNDLFRKHVFNYFEGPLTDSLDHELGHGLIISDMNLDYKPLVTEILKQEVFPILKHEGIQCSFLSDRSLWLRDYVLPMGNGKQQIFEEILLDNDGIDAAFQIAKLNPNHAFTRKWPYKFTLGLGGACTDSSKFQIQYRKGIRNLCSHNDVPYKISKAILEGGNIITVTKNNKPHVIIGKNLQYLNAVYFYDKENDSQKNNEFFSLQGNASQYQITKDARQRAKHVIEKELGLPPERITWLENDEYHLDIYLSLGPDVIFMHSNKLTFECAEKDYNETGSLLSFKVMNLAADLEKNVGDIFEKNKKKLVARGYQVVEVPGVGYNFDKSNQENNYPMMFNLMNGYSGMGKNGYFYISLTCCIQSIQDEFTRILQSHGVNNIYYVGTNEQAIKILDLHGALRCLSVSGSVIFGHLGSLFGSNSMRPNTADVDNISFSDEEISFENDSQIENEEIEMSNLTSSEEFSMEMMDNKTTSNDQMYRNNRNTMFSHSFSCNEDKSNNLSSSYGM